MINRAVGFGMGLAVVLNSFSAMANPLQGRIAVPLTSSHNLTRPATPPPMPTELPGLVARRIKRDLASRVNVPISRLKIGSTYVADWSNDCLELAYLDETCQQKNIQGWQVFIRDGDTFHGWMYRTDRTGRRLRLDLRSQSGHSNFSAELSQKLLHKASEQLQQPISNLSIGNIRAVTWEHECLGITESDTSCAQTTIPGFRAIVRNGPKEWVYHLSADGSQIVRNITASDSEGKVLVLLMNERVMDDLFNAIPKTDSQVIFQGLYRSLLSGYILTTTLTADGNVTTIHTSLGPDIDVSSPYDQSQISSEDVATFQALLEQHNFSRFDQIGYHTEDSVAFEGTYVITGAGASVELSHWETSELPEDLQPIVEAWEKITY